MKASALRTIIEMLLKEDKNSRVSAVTAVDSYGNISVMYHLCSSGELITFKVEVPKDEAVIPSITDLIPGVNFHEREVMDLFGVTFKGHPNPQRLILPDKWPEGVYPLRKDVENTELSRILSSVEGLYNEYGENPEDGSLVKIIVGPQHPALIEPEKFVLEVDGETVVNVLPRIGYVHRGVEKVAEKRTYIQDIYLVERICGICNACHAACFCQTVEEILGLEVPPRAKYLRTVILELNRIHSHMLLLGHIGLEIGYETLFHYMWRDREPVMDLIEMLTGNRVLASYITIGGVRRDISEQAVSKVKSELAKLRGRLPFYHDLFDHDPTIKLRTRNVGVLSSSDAVKFCVVGPVARASGIATDVRKDEPYAAYGEIPFDVITRDEGDSWARLMVRLDEISESIKIIEYALDHLPTGPYRVRAPRIVPEGEAMDRVEAPRGELFYYIKSNGTAYPERVKVRTPTFANILSFIHIAQGANIADVPAIFASLDPCFSCTDR
ncbi:MAG: NADH-quinone oxidoreductase subunit C [Candidatus Bathyarchaeota archaeon]|nr:NADH-quinone oxidoreductase subunit C [Candidatus Bathyarchaeota archaeon]